MKSWMRRSTCPGRIGSSGWVRSGAWTWLFSSTQSTSALGRVDVEAYDFADLLHKQRVRRQLEGLRAMRLQAEGLPDAMDRRRRVSAGACHRAQAPMGAAGRRFLQRAGDDLGDLLVADPVRRPRTWLVVEPVEPALGKAPAPLADRVRVGPHPLDNGLVLQPLCRRKHNPRPPRQSLGCLPPSRQSLKLTPLRFRQDDRYRRSAYPSALQRNQRICSDELRDQDAGRFAWPWARIHVMSAARLSERVRPPHSAVGSERASGSKKASCHTRVTIFAASSTETGFSFSCSSCANQT